MDRSAADRGLRGLRARAATEQVITFGDLVVAASDLADPSKEPSDLATDGRGPELATDEHR
jgi:hypothetical protein